MNAAKKIEIFSIGFENRNLSTLQKDLRKQDIERLVDVRCFPEAANAGWAKGSLLTQLNEIDYKHEPLLAPTPDLLKDYFELGLPWEDYEIRYLGLLRERQVETKLDMQLFEKRSCFFCLEHKPDRCHRRLALEYLANKWPGLKSTHL